MLYTSWYANPATPLPIYILQVYTHLCTYIHTHQSTYRDIHTLIHPSVHVYIHTGWFNFSTLAQKKTHINGQRNRSIIVDPAGIVLATSRLRQHRQLPVVQHVRFMPPKLCLKKTIPTTCKGLYTFGMHRCQFQHPCVLILNCALALAIYIFVVKSI